MIWLAGLLLVGLACTANPGRPVPPESPSDPRFELGAPQAAARSGATPVVDCSFDVSNRAGQTVARLIVTCELLDGDGVPVGAGLGTILGLGNGESRGVRTVVYGVRSYASARAFVTSASFQQ